MKNALTAGTIALVLAGCVTSPTKALPTLSSFNGGCRGVGLEATLAGDATDHRVAWLVVDGGRRWDVVWPPGFRARFDPNLAVLDASGRVVYRAGDKIHGGCTAGSADNPASLLLIPPP
jgi:hypothetical protein